MITTHPHRLVLGCIVLTTSCGGASVLGGSGTEAGTGSETAQPETDSDDPTLTAPTILASPPQVRVEGLAYVMIDMPVAVVDVAIDGVALEPEEVLLTDIAGALYRLPPAVPLGPGTLEVRRRDDPTAVDFADIEVVEAHFVDVAATAGVGVRHNAAGSPPECAESHTGVAWGDFDNDGAPDLFVGNVGSGGQLHRNGGDADGDGVPNFTEVTDEAGLGGVDANTMAEFIDWDGDGDLDLFVGRRGYNRMFENRFAQTGTAVFHDITNEVGLDLYSQRTMGVAFGDYDQDDDLDVYVVNHAFCFPQMGSEVRAQDHLYRNDDGVFVERTPELGSPVIASVGFSASWVDIERDGDQDLIVINDDVGGMIGDPNALWRNDGPDGMGGWVFTDVSVESGIAIPGVNGMGLALADVNRDGFVDVAFSNIGSNHLLLGDGQGGFEDVSEWAGILRGKLPWDRNSITWAAHLFDHDNDGDVDLYFSGGRIKGVALVPDAFFDNLGGGLFEELTWTAGVEDVEPGKASVIADFDRDGDWDITTTAWGADLRLYQNRVADTGEHHFVDVELQGRGGNAAAIGAIVELTAGGQTRTCFHTNRPSLGGGGETTCHFGLGSADTVDALRVTWPDGLIEAMDPPAVDARIRYVQG